MQHEHVLPGQALPDTVHTHSVSKQEVHVVMFEGMIIRTTYIHSCLLYHVSTAEHPIK